MIIKKEINISNKNQLEEFLSVGYKVNVENLKHTNKSFLLYDDVIVGRVTLWEKNNDNKKILYFGNFFAYSWEFSAIFFKPSKPLLTHSTSKW